MTKRPYADTRLAKFVEKRTLELRPRKSQIVIATEAGFLNPNVVSMIRSGASKLALDRVPGLAAALECDPKHLSRLALEQTWGSTSARTIDEIFLIERRVRMAKVIRCAWEDLSGRTKPVLAAPIIISDLIANGEGDEVEFKSTLRTNLHTGLPDDKIQLSVLKTIAGFLNSKGDTLLIGVADSGEVLGLEDDGFSNEDKMGLHLVNLMKERLGDVFLPYIHYRFQDEDGKRALVVRIEKGSKPAFLKDGATQRFYVRGGASTVELQGGSVTDYVKQRFE